MRESRLSSALGVLNPRGRNMYPGFSPSRIFPGCELLKASSKLNVWSIIGASRKKQDFEA